MPSTKNIKKLADKKYRTETGLFIVEGEKNIKELLESDFVIEGILGTSFFLDSIIDMVNAYDERMHTRIELKVIKEEELSRSGTFVTNTTGIAVVYQKNQVGTEDILGDAQKNIVLALDDVRDPGNLGTIIRIADWFGMTHIIASPSTTDFYSPKTISATMGSFTRIQITYTDLQDFLQEASALKIPVTVAVMNGESTHKSSLPQHGLLLMGSESHGVNEELLTLATNRVTIPRFGKAESLNVGVATGILLDSLKRNS